MRSHRTFLATLAALAAILFTQVAIAASAWRDAPSPCHEQMPSANLCAAHCANNDLALDVPQVKVPAAASASERFSIVTPVPYPQVAPVRIAVLPAGPPPRILFQSFLI